ncbi:hypothetical protein ACH4Q6_05875 [Streptomyces lydicus]|uniref:hypothetical protein n=1 Tax=Streptomyces lydicus TaxID=47763 RepID=UPI00378E4C09
MPAVLKIKDSALVRNGRRRIRVARYAARRAVHRAVTRDPRPPRTARGARGVGHGVSPGSALRSRPLGRAAGRFR